MEGLEWYSGVCESLVCMRIQGLRCLQGIFKQLPTPGVAVGSLQQPGFQE